MNNFALKKMNFIILSFYALTFIFTIFNLIFSIPITVVKVFIFFMFVSDVYFVVTFYSSKREKLKLNKKSKVYLRAKLIFVLQNLMTLLPFFLTILTLLMAFNIVSFEMIVSKNITTVNFFTYAYPNLFFIYLIRIGQFYYHFAKKYHCQFVASICSKLTLIIFVLLAGIFFIVYYNLNKMVIHKVFTSQNEFIEQLIYNTSMSLSEYLEDSYSDDERRQIFSDFASTNNVKEIMLRVGTSLYQTSDRNDLFNKNFIFDMLIVKSDEFVLVLPGKDFSNAIYLTIIIFIAITACTLFPMIVFLKTILNKMIAAPIRIMTEGIKYKESNAIIDLEDMEDDELLELYTSYNNIYIALKYRDLFMNDMPKREVSDE